MTTLYQEEKSCVLCGTKSEHTGIAGTNSFGSPDLDFRPPEMQRSTMAYWVQECPGCGYAYSSIDESAPQAETTLASDAYKAILSSPLDGSITGRFLKASLISECALDPEAAANYALNAAWAADDAYNIEEAISHRNRAADLFEVMLNDLDGKSEHAMVTRTRMMDVLRRAERWDEAIKLAGILLETKLDPTIRTILEFERSAAAKQDNLCYTIAKALGDE